MCILIVNYNIVLGTKTICSWSDIGYQVDAME